MKTKISFLIFFFFNPFFFICGVVPCLAERLSFLVIYGDTCAVNMAFNELELPDKIKAASANPTDPLNEIIPRQDSAIAKFTL